MKALVCAIASAQTVKKKEPDIVADGAGASGIAYYVTKNKRRKNKVRSRFAPPPAGMPDLLLALTPETTIRGTTTPNAPGQAFSVYDFIDAVFAPDRPRRTGMADTSHDSADMPLYAPLCTGLYLRFTTSVRCPSPRALYTYRSAAPCAVPAYMYGPRSRVRIRHSPKKSRPRAAPAAVWDRSRWM